MGEGRPGGRKWHLCKQNFILKKKFGQCFFYINIFLKTSTKTSLAFSCLAIEYSQLLTSFVHFEMFDSIIAVYYYYCFDWRFSADGQATFNNLGPKT